MKKVLFIVGLLPIMLLLGINKSILATDLPTGTVSTATTLTLAQSPYYVVGNIQYNEDLTIEAGVNIIFNGDYTFLVNGKITANGSSASPIIFKSNSTTVQGTVELHPDIPALSSASYWSLDKLTTGIYMTNDFTVSQMNAQDCITGFKLTGESILTNFEATSCTKGVRIEGSAEISSGTIEDCLQQGVYIYLSGNRVVNVSDLIVDGNGLEGEYDGIYAKQQGSGTSQVDFDNIEVRNSTMSGIYLYGYNGFNSSIDNSIIESNILNGIYCSGPAYLSMLNNKVRTNGEKGVILRCTGNTEINFLDIEDNGDVGIQVDAAGTSLKFENCSFYNNTNYDFYNNVSLNINAENNYWLYSDSTIISSRIYDKTDNSSKGIVDFQPFLFDKPQFYILPADFNASVKSSLI